MPSTIGHAIAGATVVWAADACAPPPTSARAQPTPGGLTLACMAIAGAPDLDLLFQTHRTMTHSIGATMFVGLFAAAWAANARAPILRTALVCAAAHASHLLLDWMALDRFPPHGLQALWPFSRAFYISGWDLFLQTERRHFFTLAALKTNSVAVAREIAILGPIAWLVYRLKPAPLPHESKL